MTLKYGREGQYSRNWSVTGAQVLTQGHSGNLKLWPLPILPEHLWLQELDWIPTDMLVSLLNSAGAARHSQSISPFFLFYFIQFLLQKRAGCDNCHHAVVAAQGWCCRRPRCMWFASSFWRCLSGKPPYERACATHSHFVLSFLGTLLKMTSIVTCSSYWI